LPAFAGEAFAEDAVAEDAVAEDALAEEAFLGNRVTYTAIDIDTHMIETITAKMTIFDVPAG
jgi:hypothetical protein